MFLPSVQGMLQAMSSDMCGLENDLVNVMDLIKVVPFAIINNPSTQRMIIVIEEVTNALSSIALTLLLFFFFYDFLKKTVMLEFVNWENIVKLMLRFFLAKIVLDNCHVIFEGMALVASGMLDSITAINLPHALAQADSWNDVIARFQRIINPLTAILYYVKYHIVWLGMMVIRLAVLVIVYGRFIEICIYTAIAPIPLATLASEDFSHIAKKFLQGYMAVLLQGVIILVMCYIYVGLVANWLQPSPWFQAAGNLVQYIVSALVLLFTLLKSGNWAKQIMGA